MVYAHIIYYSLANYKYTIRIYVITKTIYNKSATTWPIYSLKLIIDINYFFSALILYHILLFYKINFNFLYNLDKKKKKLNKLKGAFSITFNYTGSFFKMSNIKKFF